MTIGPLNPDQPQIPDEIQAQIAEMAQKIQEELGGLLDNKAEVKVVGVNMTRIEQIMKSQGERLRAMPEDGADLMNEVKDGHDVALDDPRWENAGEFMRTSTQFWTSQDLQLAAGHTGDRLDPGVVGMLTTAPKIMEWIHAMERPRCPIELRAELIRLCNTPAKFESPPGAVEFNRRYVCLHLDQMPPQATELMREAVFRLASWWLVPEE